MKNFALHIRSIAIATVAAVGFAGLLGTAQLSAQVQVDSIAECKSELAKVEPMVMSKKDDDQNKAAAMTELNAAKAMMAKNDAQACMQHLRSIRKMYQDR